MLSIMNVHFSLPLAIIILTNEWPFLYLLRVCLYPRKNTEMLAKHMEADIRAHNVWLEATVKADSGAHKVTMHG